MRGKIKNGKLKLRDKDQWKKKVQELEGEDVRVDLEKWYKRRTNPQNSYYWGVVVDILAQETGYTPDEMHKALKQKFLSKKEVLDEQVEQSTKKLSTKEFEDYMKEIRMWASSDLNCFIPEPNEAEEYAYKPEKL